MTEDEEDEDDDDDKKKEAAEEDEDEHLKDNAQENQDERQVLPSTKVQILTQLLSFFLCSLFFFYFERLEREIQHERQIA